MKNKTYLILIIIFTVILIVFSAYEITKLKNEIVELKDSQAKLMDEKECYDLFYDNEGLVILEAEETENYCNNLINS